MNIANLLPFSLETAVTVMAAVAAFGTVCVVWAAMLVPDLMSARAKRLHQRRGELRSDLMSARRQTRHKTAAVGVMRQVAQRFNLLRTKTGAKTSERLAQAGWRHKDALVIFVFMKLVLPFVFGATAFVLFNLMAIIELKEPFSIIVPLIGVGLGADRKSVV